MSAFHTGGLTSLTISERLAAAGCSHHRVEDTPSRRHLHLVYVTATREPIGTLHALEAADWLHTLLTAGD